MDISITDHTDVEKEVAVTLSPEELIPHFEKAYKKEQAKIEIKGFRKGKAPLEMIKRIYGESIQYEALDDIANDVFKSILEERNIYPLGEPSLTDIKFKPGEPLTFSVKYEVAPDFELKEYKGVEVEKYIYKLTEDDVEDEILRIRKSNSTLTEAVSATDDEHVVTVDIQELDDSGSPLIGRKSTDSRIYLASDEIAPEIKYALQDVKVNESRQANFEVSHGDHKHLNNWEMLVTKVEKVNVPELDDEFVKKATRLKVSTVDEFRENIKKDLEKYFNDNSEQQLKDAIAREIVKKHDFNVPKAMVKSLLDARLDDLKSQAPNKQLPDDFDEKAFRESYTPLATFQAKWFLIRDRIIHNEQLTVTDAELEKRAEEDAPKMSIEKERLLAFYKSSDALKERIAQDKLMEFLISNAVVTEKIQEREEQFL